MFFSCVFVASLIYINIYIYIINLAMVVCGFCPCFSPDVTWEAELSSFSASSFSFFLSFSLSLSVCLLCVCCFPACASASADLVVPYRLLVSEMEILRPVFACICRRRRRLCVCVCLLSFVLVRRSFCLLACCFRSIFTIYILLIPCAERAGL
jgi:hypothetical protein